MKSTIKDLLESMIDEYNLDEDSLESIIHEYADRIIEILSEDNGVYYPESMLYID